jgi:hypothetical protein
MTSTAASIGRACDLRGPLGDVKSLGSGEPGQLMAELTEEQKAVWRTGAHWLAELTVGKPNCEPPKSLSSD